MNKTKLLIPLIIILLIGSSLRFYKLDFQSLWVDELATLRRAEVESVQNIIHMATTIDIHPPGIYIIYYYWLKILPNSEANFRLLSAISGSLAILAIFILAMRLYSRKEGLISALIVAVSWFPIYYSQEARPYSLLFLFSIINSIFYWQLVNKFYLNHSESWINSTLYILSASITMYIHYFGTYLIFLHGIFLLIIAVREKKYFYEWLIIYSLIFILFLPWLPSMIFQLKGGVGTGIYSAPNLGELLNYLIYINNNSKLIFGISILLVAVPSLTILINKKFKIPDVLKSINNETIFLLLWFVIPLFMIVLFSHIVKPVFSFKNMIISYAPMPILISRLVVKSNSKNRVKFLLVSLYVSLLVFHLIFKKQYYERPTKEQFREVAQYVNSKYDHEQNPDVFALSYAGEYFNYYFKKFNSEIRVDECVQLENRDSEIELALSKCKSKQLWFISAHQSPDKRILNILNNHYTLVHKKEFIGAHAAVYSRI